MGPLVDVLEPSVAKCDQFATYFAITIACIRSNMNFGIDIQNLDVHMHPACLIL